MKAAYDLGLLLRNNHPYISKRFNAWQSRTLFALSRCRTAIMGGHIDRCTHPSCGKLHLSYNSCRNRHCPKCQGHKREEWIQAREADLLPVGYFHLVFTLPSELNTLALSHPKLVYATLFKTAWSVIKGFGDNSKFLGATPGMIAVLHTWGQNLSLHPHLHCIIASGGVDVAGKWKNVKGKNNFLFPVKELSKVFRARYVVTLRKQGIKDKALFDALFSKDWVVYAKKPFGSPNSVIAYLGRYTHKIAISNHRIVKADQAAVSFKVKNYKKNGKQEICTLETNEFIRRFALHILPKGFVRIRHYGFLSSTGKAKYLSSLKDQLGRPRLKKKIASLHLVCPSCKKGRLVTLCTFDNRGPPKRWIAQLTNQNNVQKTKQA